MGGHGWHSHVRRGIFPPFLSFYCMAHRGTCTMYVYVRAVESGLRVAAITRGGGVGQFLPHRASAIVTFRFH